MINTDIILEQFLYDFKEYKKIIIRLNTYDAELIAKLQQFCNKLNQLVTIICDSGEVVNYSQEQQYEFYLYILNKYDKCFALIKDTLDFRNNLYKQYNLEHFIKNGRWHIAYFPDSIEKNMQYILLTKKDYYYLMKKSIDLLLLIKKENKIKIISKKHSLCLSYKSNRVFSSFGQHNTPDGEIGVIPDIYSTEGSIYFPIVQYQKHIFHNVFMEFKNGKCIRYSCNENKEFKNILFYDEYSSYIGEFAFGLNPWIKGNSQETIVAEKCFGTFHIALGGVRDDFKTAFVHMDMINNNYNTSIYIGNTCIYKNGLFINELDYFTSEYLLDYDKKGE